MTLKLKVIIGATRPGRAGPVIGDWAAKAAEAFGGFDVELVDLASFNLPLLDEPNHPAMKQYEHDHTKAWSAVIDDADAFVFVTPEYDYFPPASLVNALQCLSQEWRYKPAATVSYAYVSGGLRAAQELRLLMSNLQMMPLPQVVPVPFFPQFVKDGVVEPNEPMTDGMNATLGELAKWAEALKPMRG
ncbi:NADPH-dependent FMN reductase [Pseudodonghicola flavimaris]|uniref:NAD(P)H-dependent oxidoreductase n=1 Tax=Pseudodonghicola flavimaris TaxID=3050036 RepID=A0ABT7F7S7_9RHOB|nr:NAD(P)H-dependent oxidoreductase [Pseudodonghicola flavimaris]MDK3020663.1 NAD(P)H-dependent oxidoreductase [Pseudodonghicola flavimaris]